MLCFVHQTGSIDELCCPVEKRNTGVDSLRVKSRADSQRKRVEELSFFKGLRALFFHLPYVLRTGTSGGAQRKVLRASRLPHLG